MLQFPHVFLVGKLCLICFPLLIKVFVKLLDMFFHLGIGYTTIPMQDFFPMEIKKLVNIITPKRKCQIVTIFYAQFGGFQKNRNQSVQRIDFIIVQGWANSKRPTEQ